VVLAISVDPPETTRTIVEADGLGFPVLSDVGLAATRAFGVLHPGGNPLDGGDLARPATFIVDRQGRVAWRDLTENWRVRPRPSVLLAELARIP
jgi:peroxiredoxin